MKIRNEQLQALQQAEAKGKPKGTGTGFDSLFSQELASAGAAGESTAAPGARPVPGAVPAMDVPSAGAVENAFGDASLETVTGSIDAMLGSLDAYAETLSNPQGADLRKAYGLLRSVDRDLEALRQATPDLAVRHAGLSSMVDELSVIARAETVKMNRGDYL